MRLPEIDGFSSTRQVVNTFTGINHQSVVSDGQWYDACNLSTDNYPILSTRAPRGVLNINMPDGTTENGKVRAIENNNGWFFLYGTDTVVNGHTVKDTALYYAQVAAVDDIDAVKVSGNVQFSAASYIVSMGAYVIVMPEGYYYNTANADDNGMISVAWSGSCGVIACDREGKEYSYSLTKPATPANNDKYYDSQAKALYIYSGAQQQWVQINTENYIKVRGSGISEAFTVGDGVCFEWNNAALNVDTIKTVNTTWELYKQLDGDKVVVYMQKDDDDEFIVIQTESFVEVTTGNAGAIDTSFKWKVTRKLPALDYVVESNNRLWGCHYGTDDDGNVLNEIYACKLGDFKNWYCYAGVSSDSYTASVGAPGVFTGAVCYNGYPLFFKEHCLFKVYGSYPSNYQISMDNIIGVVAGGGRSLQVVNEVLYYQGRDGIYSYNGTAPAKVSYVLGALGEYAGIDEMLDGIRHKAGSATVLNTIGMYGTLLLAKNSGGDGVRFMDARYGSVATTCNGKYIIDKVSKVQPFDDNYQPIFERYVYDTTTNVWHRESADRAASFKAFEGNAFYSTGKAGDTALHAINYTASTEADPEIIEWYAISGPTGTDDATHKYISRIDLRMSLDMGSRLMLYIQYDGAGDWQHIASLTGTGMRVFSLPVRLKRCDHYRLKLVGRGPAKIYSIIKNVETGSDL